MKSLFYQYINRKNMNYETSDEIEYAVANWFGIRTHVIVPNLSWGLVKHECDLAVLSPSEYLYEVEIKISHSDLIRDKSKRKWLFYDERGFRKLWFAIPEKLKNSIEQVPSKAGILIITQYGVVYEIRKPKININATKLLEIQKFKLARLGTMRIWKLKHELILRDNQKNMEIKNDIN